MNRRSFLSAVLALGAAPYVVTSTGVLMPVHQIISTPELAVFDGTSTRYWINGLPVNKNEFAFWSRTTSGLAVPFRYGKRS